MTGGTRTVQSTVRAQAANRMESFFLAETVKYAWLLAEPSALDFDAVVFNTEAHPLARTGR